MKLPLLSGLAIFSAACLAASAQESRTWTDTKGRTLEGVFVRQDDSTVWIKKPDGKELALPKKSLSEEDLKHLTSAPSTPTAGGSGSGGTAAAAAGAGAGAGTGRFASARIDPGTWKQTPGGAKFDTLLFPANLETEHFLILGYEKTKLTMLQAYANAAERLWSDIASDLPELAESYKGLRMPIVLADGEKQAQMFSDWHDKHAKDSPTVGYAGRLTDAGIAAYRLDPKFAEENKLTQTGRLFRLDSKAAHTRPTWPERIHFLSSDIFASILGDSKANGDVSLSMIRQAFAYHREQLVCGRIESEVSYGGGGTDVEGFKNGRNWAGATKKLLKGGAKTDIKAYLETDAAKAEPRDLGFGLGLMQFIHADATRKAGFGKMLEKTRTDKKCPDVEGFAKALGFNSPEELNAGWLAYMNSDAFQ